MRKKISIGKGTTHLDNKGPVKKFFDGLFLLFIVACIIYILVMIA